MKNWNVKSSVKSVVKRTKTSAIKPTKTTVQKLPTLKGKKSCCK